MKAMILIFSGFLLPTALATVAFGGEAGHPMAHSPAPVEVVASTR